jgi:hypothetical protein
MVRKLHDGATEEVQAHKNAIHDRLLAQTEPDPVSGCWIYTGYWDEHGNARIRVGDRPYTVQRAAAWVYWDDFELDSEELIVHSCETPACWNPKHLVRCATRGDMLAYMDKRGRPCRRHLTRALAEEIRVRASTMSRTAQVHEYHVGHASIRSILRGEAWASV